MLELDLPQNLLKRGISKCEEQRKQLMSKSKPSCSQSGASAESGHSLCQVRPGLYLTRWLVHSACFVPFCCTLPLHSAVPHPWQVWQHLGTSFACLLLLLHPGRKVPHTNPV